MRAIVISSPYLALIASTFRKYGRLMAILWVNVLIIVVVLGHSPFNRLPVALLGLAAVLIYVVFLILEINSKIVYDPIAFKAFAIGSLHRTAPADGSAQIQ